ncbi:efflux RND transporter periplasmic adaptor subunit [Paenibacillus silagei]|uniref:HlyD family secretion protein n=1 Tax=Paenibacillus silagei TaxID=1670801 RepID=A0ABS4NSY2_9BACL|nr:efflux RND transporter periplasmic adaptor subunit [Paenibacillus silagei]MBP2113163.1 HlyD family secretion protein [Paenibacillus silagei]
MNVKKTLGLSAAVIVTAGIVVYSLWPDKSTQDSPPTAQTTVVTKDDISVTVKGSGTVKATNTTIVYARDTGNVAKVLVKENEQVKKGQILLTYEGANVASNVRIQQNTLKQSQNDLLEKQDQYKKLIMDSAALTDIDAAKLAIERTKDTITATLTELEALKKDHIPPASLTAPMDGTVTKISASSGGMVTKGAEVFSITDYKNLSATIKIDELDIPKIKPGMSAAIKMDALPAEVYPAKVTRIADEGTVTNGVSVFEVTLLLTDSTGARAGMSAQGVVTIEEKNQVLLLPVESVTQKDNKYYVQVQDSVPEQAPSPKGSSAAGSPATPPPVQLKPVTVGVHDESRIEIVSGLREGEQVIVPTIIAVSTPAPAAPGMFDMGGDEGGFDGSDGGGAGGGPQ